MSRWGWCGRFYEEMQGGGNMAGALRAAQAWLRGLSGAELRLPEATLPEGFLVPDYPAEARPAAHPRDWAGFMLVIGNS